MIPFFSHWHGQTLWLGINSKLVVGFLFNIILLIIMSFSSINILIWKQSMISDFIYIFVLWKNNLMRNHLAH